MVSISEIGRTVCEQVMEDKIACENIYDVLGVRDEERYSQHRSTLSEHRRRKKKTLFALKWLSSMTSPMANTYSKSKYVQIDEYGAQ